MNYNNDSFIFADYGSMVIKPETLALLRGTGNFNPSPNYEQSINRNYNPLDYYANSKYYNDDQAIKAESAYENENNVKWIPDYDTANKRKYIVGSTDLHTEDEKNWGIPDFMNSRGTDRYQTWALASTNMTPNVLVYLFFSEDNVNYIQQTLIREVKRIRNIDINEQSVDELLIIMRNKYLYALSGWLNSAGDINVPQARGTILNPNGLAYDSNDNEGCTSLYVQVSRLNKAVVEECLKMILSSIDAYNKYYLDSSSIPMALSHPVYASHKGDNVLQENLGFLSSHEMNNAITSYNQRFNII
jgi:hypothetical protein